MSKLEQSPGGSGLWAGETLEHFLGGFSPLESFQGGFSADVIANGNGFSLVCLVLLT